MLTLDSILAIALVVHALVGYLTKTNTVLGPIYKAKTARRPARPAPKYWTEVLSAAPAAAVDEGLPVDPEAVPEEAADPEADPNTQLANRGQGQDTEIIANIPLVPVGRTVLAAAPELPAAVPLGAAAPAPAPPSWKAVWLLGKRLLMQASTHLE